MTDLTIHFSADVTAADTQRRTIVGTVAPYGAIGNTSLGPVSFLPGSLRASDDVKLLLEHDGRRPIGRATSFQDSTLGLLGTFRVAQTTAGTDALVEASEGLRGGLSVGARILEHTIGKAGEMLVSAAELVEVSLVTSPAFAEAQVSHVAASTPDDDEPTESQEDIVENETTEVAAAEVVASPQPVVEAARPSIPYITAAPRDVKGITAGGHLRHVLKARMGDQDSQDVVNYVQADLAKQDTTRDAGVIPVPLLREIIALVDANRPFVESIDRQPLIAEGMSFRIPKVTTSAAVGYQATELSEVTSTQGQIQDITVNVRTFAGANLVSRQLIDRSDPSYFEELLRQLAQSYAHGTDKKAYDELKGSSASTPSGAGNVASLYAAVVKGISDAYGIMRFVPNRILVAPGGTSGTSWTDFLGARDSDGRPLFAAAAPSNAAGLITQGSTNGTVAGLDMIVDPHIGANEKAHVYPSGFATFYETPGSPFQVQVTDVANLGVEVGVYGYFAMAAKFPTAIRQLNIYAG
jgi:HK97 family phage prohead protease